MKSLPSTAVHALRSNSRRFVVLGAALALGVAASTQAGGAASGRTVRTQGDEQFVPNAKIMSTLKFSPGHITINNGETLTFEHGDQTQDPHTLTIVDQADLPANINDVFNCGAPGTVCDDIFQLLPGGPPPAGSAFFNVAGGAGLDARGDTMFLLPGETVSAPVTAPSGSTLYFMCLIHPWMQGSIKVH